MKICAFVYLSNHCHLLVRPDSVQQLAGFMRDVNSKIGREAGRLHDWTEKLWGRRYTSIVVSEEPEAQIQRLRYLLEQGCKERLVASPKHWPGASSTKALLSGKVLEGIWIDRTEQYKTRERGQPNADSLFTTTHRVELSPLPCWMELEPHEYQARTRAIVREIESAMEGVEVLGKERICRQDPYSRPASNPRRRRNPAPRFHAIDAQVRTGPGVGLSTRADRVSPGLWGPVRREETRLPARLLRARVLPAPYDLGSGGDIPLARLVPGPRPHR